MTLARSVSLSLAFSGLIWRRHRTALSIILGLLALAAVAARVSLPPEWHPWRIPFALLADMGLLHLLVIFGLMQASGPEADVAGTSSGYPKSLMTLPLTTGELVGTPMAVGAAGYALAWAAYTYFVLQPLGVPVPVVVPALIAMATCAGFQSVVWTTVPIPYLKVLLVPGILVASITAGVASAVFGVPLAWQATAVLVTVAAAWAVGRAGLGRERNGLDPRIRREDRASAPTNEDPAFRSGFHAQLWADWTRSRAILPVVATGVAGLFAVLVLLLPDAGRFEFAGYSWPERARIWGIGVGLLFLAGGTVGSTPRKGDMYRPDLSLQPFLAVRPLSNVQIVAVKFAVAALTAAVSVLIVVLAAVPLLFVQGHAPTGPVTLGSLLAHHWPRVLLAVLLLFLFQWRGSLGSLVAELTGRKWTTALGASGIVLIGLSLPLGLTYPSRIPEVVRALPTVFTVAVVLKALLSVLAARTLLKKRLVSPQALAAFATLWLTLGTAFCFAFRWTGPLGQVALTVALFLPATRILAAPLALDWNRHR